MPIISATVSAIARTVAPRETGEKVIMVVRAMENKNVEDINIIIGDGLTTVLQCILIEYVAFVVMILISKYINIKRFILHLQSVSIMLRLQSQSGAPP